MQTLGYLLLGWGCVMGLFGMEGIAEEKSRLGFMFFGFGITISIVGALMIG